ncbi:MAG: hypothetical protein ACSHX0_10495 [Akkermansiaceae bacterium]
MNWILIAYLLGLMFFSTKPEESTRRAPFRAAWITFALIPFWQFLMHLFRAGNIRDANAMRLIEVWDQAVPSLLLSVSLFCLLAALAPKSESSLYDDHE